MGQNPPWQHRKASNRGTVASRVDEQLRFAIQVWSANTDEDCSEPVHFQGVPLALGRRSMTTFLLSALLLVTIVASFSLGIAVGYWAICGILNFFDPGRDQEVGRVPRCWPTLRAATKGSLQLLCRLSARGNSRNTLCVRTVKKFITTHPQVVWRCCTSPHCGYSPLTKWDVWQSATAIFERSYEVLRNASRWRVTLITARPKSKPHTEIVLMEVSWYGFGARHDATF